MANAKCYAIILLCAALLSACSEEEPARAPAATGSPAAPSAAAAPAASTAPVEPARVEVPPPRTVEKADRSRLLSDYKVLDSGRTLMFAYLSVDTMPIDYERIAALVSAEYARSNDEFRRRDLLGALKPGIDAEVERAKANRYYRMIGSADLEKYDFATRSFRVGTFSGNGAGIYFSDNNAFSLNFANAQQFQNLPVPDEAQARRIEALRASYKRMSLAIYVFAAEAQLGQPVLMGEVVKVQLRDENGNVLAEM